ncbi:MAG: hypothetical protein ABOK23_12095 [Candidatus Methanoperedens sp.]|nr:hypothetical protein [Candidatus Methanoperedens sp.]
MRFIEGIELELTYTVMFRNWITQRRESTPADNPTKTPDNATGPSYAFSDS